ncbi:MULTISPECIES: DUF3429 domain-containing protein [unclassified Roseateles]|uniref:DUF3429 domain-containing protein n=1 Tax=unclassified Roseateles TaxID=2626991 RepID=UPI0006F706D7|nr:MULTISPECIES: DUF3429 domain-containing protein [unclassified Roseateles]KQW42119.1 hypothetical protein ASC81_22735 [Pelomonas sp. Root405]KRA67722.1 hypothetical protein ASD88_24320 [Pelomonas sp. Root662]
MSADHRQLAHRLAYAGLIPFVVGCALIWLIGDRDLDQHAFVSLAMSAYAGLVISFLGGIHWGLSFARGLPGRQPLVWGVFASLLGWLGVLMAPYAGLALHGGVLIVCYAIDRRVYPQLGAGDWLTLRFRLTAVAALSCFLAAAGS